MNDPTQPPEEIADGVPRKLDLRFVTVERMTGWIFTLVLSGLSLFGILLAIFVADSGDGATIAVVSAWVALSAAFAALSHFWPAAAWHCASWALDAHGLEVRRGVFWREVVHVPRSRVQHTDVSQGPLERRFGLATLIVHTAGTHHASVSLPGLERGTAMRIRNHLVVAGRGDAV